MNYYLIDCWNALTREIEPDGFSAVRAVHPRELEALPRCPGCGNDVWLRATKYPFAVEFSGSRVGDIAFHLGSTLVLSDRFRRAWMEEHFVGLLFSDAPLQTHFLMGASTIRADERFFAAYPEPELSPLAKSAGAKYESHPTCSTCGVDVVESLEKIEFSPQSAPQSDFFLPSPLSGWYGVSERAFDLIRKRRFQNFRFLRGFSGGYGSDLRCQYV